MELRFVPPDLRRLDDLSAEVASCALFEDDWPLIGLAGLFDWRLAGRLSALGRRGYLTGARDEVMLVPGRPRVPFEKLVLLGLGRREDFDDDACVRALERVGDVLEGLKVRRAVVELPGRGGGAIGAERAAELLLRTLGSSKEHDAWWLVEEEHAGQVVTARMREDQGRRRT
jgi:hypothetical protein